MATRGCIGFRDSAEAEKQQNAACSKGCDREKMDLVKFSQRHLLPIVLKLAVNDKTQEVSGQDFYNSDKTGVLDFSQGERGI